MGKRRGQLDIALNDRFDERDMFRVACLRILMDVGDVQASAALTKGIHEHTQQVVPAELFDLCVHGTTLCVEITESATRQSTCGGAQRR